MTLKASEKNMGQLLDSAGTDPSSWTSDPTSLSVQNKMRASSVKRWHIIETSRPQSLAEHSFNVAIIAIELLKEIGEPDNWRGYVLDLALHHDLDEVKEGDIPASAKTGPGFDYSQPLCPYWFVKVADTIDAYIFINEFGAGRTGKYAQEFMQTEVDEMFGQMDYHLRNSVDKVMNKIISGDFNE